MKNPLKKFQMTTTQSSSFNYETISPFEKFK